MPKDNPVLGPGRLMDSRLIFRPFRADRWMDGAQYARRIIGFVSGASVCLPGKSGRGRKAHTSVRAKAARLKLAKRASKKNFYDYLRGTRTAIRNRWAGMIVPRRTGDYWLRNSAKKRPYLRYMAYHPMRSIGNSKF